MPVKPDKKKSALDLRREKRLVRFLPIALDVRGQKIVVVGGGKVALQKLKTLLLFGPKVTVCAKEVMPEIKALAGVRCFRMPYQAGLLKGAVLVYACTSSRTTNRAVARDAAAQRILCNVADDTDVCAFISPAVLVEGDLIVAINSQGRAPKAAREARDFIKEKIHEFYHGRG